MSLQKISGFSSRLTPLLALLIAVSCSTGPTQITAQRPLRAISATNEIAANLPAQPIARGCDGSNQLTRVERSAIIGAAVQAARSELDQNPKSIRDQNVRDRIGTFAAIWIDDAVPLISLDRLCWAEFAEAKKYLGEGDELAATAAGEAWRICLEATFPDRVAIAHPYFSCFIPEASKAPAPSDL